MKYKTEAELKAKQTLRKSLIQGVNSLCDHADETSKISEHFSLVLAGLCTIAQEFIDIQKIPLSVELIDTETGENVEKKLFTYDN